MTKQDYLNNLLNLCTESQKDLFNRMYPNGVSNKQLSHAIYQVENTLRELNTKKEIVQNKNKDLTDTINSLEEEIKTLKRKLYYSELEYKESIDLIDRLKNPISIKNNEVQERLIRLQLLEAGGVDNWDGYDYAINNDKY